jgi:hypothetical protein
LCDPNPEKQAKRVLVNKWERRPDNAVTDTPDYKIADKFHEMFAEPLSPYKRKRCVSSSPCEERSGT